MGYELIAVERPEDWSAFHAIRRRELFEARGRFGVYDEAHPDDRAGFANPFLLKLDGRPIGTVRLDLLGDGRAVFRLVAVTADAQGRGHGRAMAALVEERAMALGARVLLVNAAREAVGYYRKLGWTEHVWDPAELRDLAAAAVQMHKIL